MKHISLIVKILFVGALFFAIFEFTDWRNLLDQAKQISPVTILALILLVLLQAALLSLRWTRLAHMTNHHLPYLTAFAGTLVSFFLSQGLPSTVSGDALRIWWMRRNGILMRDSTITIVFDRLFGLVSLLIVCIFSLLLLADRSQHPALTAASQTLAACIVLGLTGSALLMLPNRTGLSDWVFRIAVRMPRWIATPVHWILEFRNVASQLSRDVVNLGMILVIGIGVHFLTVLSGFLVARDLNLNVSIFGCLAAIAPALLISYLPISIAGWGVRETSIMTAFGLIGVGTEPALIISLAIGFSVLATSILGGLIWLLSGVREAYVKSPLAERKSQPG